MGRESDGRWVFTPNELKDLAEGPQTRQQAGPSASRSSNISGCSVP